MSPGNTQIARAYFDAWNNHDVEAIVSLFSDTGTFWDNKMANPVALYEAKVGFASFLVSVPDLKFDIKNLVQSENSVIIEWRMSGTSKSTGKTFEVPGVDVFDMAHGKIAAARAYFNEAPVTL